MYLQNHTFDLDIQSTHKPWYLSEQLACPISCMNFQRVELKNPHECKIHKNHRKNFFDLSFSQKFYIFHLDEFGMDCQILLEIFVQILKPSLEERVLNRSYRLLQTRCVLLQRMCREHHGYRTIEYRVAQN